MTTVKTVTVQNISKEDQRVRTKHGEAKEVVKPGGKFDIAIGRANELTRMYSKLFKIVSAKVEEPKTEVTKETKKGKFGKK